MLSGLLILDADVGHVRQAFEGHTLLDASDPGSLTSGGLQYKKHQIHTLIFMI